MSGIRPNCDFIEERFKEALTLYVEHGYRPGDFLFEVLSNNLRGAVERGDDYALANLPHIVAYLYNCCPSNCWGSPEKVETWRLGFKKETENTE